MCHRRHTPYYTNPDIRVYELNRRLQQRTEVGRSFACWEEIFVACNHSFEAFAAWAVFCLCLDGQSSEDFRSYI